MEGARLVFFPPASPPLEGRVEGARLVFFPPASPPPEGRVEGARLVFFPRLIYSYNLVKYSNKKHANYVFLLKAALIYPVISTFILTTFTFFPGRKLI